MENPYRERTLVLTIRASDHPVGFEVWATLYDAGEVERNNLLSIRVMDPEVDFPFDLRVDLLDLLIIESARFSRLC